jgi:secreted Zn-dependent insulinase-like peptidase
LDPDRTVEGKCARIFYEIATRRFVFDRREQQVQHLKSVTKRHLLRLFDDYLATGGKKRKEVCAMVVGKAALSAREADDYRTSDGSCVYILNGHAGRGVTFEDIAMVPEAFYYEQP